MISYSLTKLNICLKYSILIVLSIAAILYSCNSQLNKLPETTNSFTIAKADSVIKGSLATEQKRIAYDNTKYYHYLLNQEVKVTQGGASGKLLNGKYEVFDKQMSILKSGSLKDGLKIGEWKDWHTNGSLKRRVQYKRGVEHGHYFEYNSQGRLRITGKFKNGLKHGIAKELDVDGKVISYIIYKNGFIVPNKSSKKEIITKKEKPKEREKRENNPKKST
jgi:antitoxin component YwqK of YwqJK toxin-antitoxin module